MADFLFDPPLAGTGGAFVQRVDLRERGKVIATARWHSPAGIDGVAQILDFSVIESHRRTGNGGLLLRATLDQAVAHGQARGVPLRRVWVSVEQKTQVIARAFLTKHGFHHVSTMKDLLAKQDALVYVKSLD